MKVTYLCMQKMFALHIYETLIHLVMLMRYARNHKKKIGRKVKNM